MRYSLSTFLSQIHDRIEIVETLSSFHDKWNLFHSKRYLNIDHNRQEIHRNFYLPISTYSSLAGTPYLGTPTTDVWWLFPKFFTPLSYLGDIWDIFVLGLKTKVFCRKNNQIHFPMDKGLAVPKWALIVRPKIPQMPQKYISPICLPPKPKRLGYHWKKASSDVRGPCLEESIFFACVRILKFFSLYFLSD